MRNAAFFLRVAFRIVGNRARVVENAAAWRAEEREDVSEVRVEPVIISEASTQTDSSPAVELPAAGRESRKDAGVKTFETVSDSGEAQ